MEFETQQIPILKRVFSLFLINFELCLYRRLIKARLFISSSIIYPIYNAKLTMVRFTEVTFGEVIQVCLLLWCEDAFEIVYLLANCWCGKHLNILSYKIIGVT